MSDGGSQVNLSTLRLVSGDSGEHLVTVVFDRMDSSASNNAREIAAKALKMVPQEGFSICVMKADGRLMLYHDFSSDRAALNAALSQATDDERSIGVKGSEAAEKRLITIAKNGTDETGAKVSAKDRAAAQIVLATLQESQQVVQELHTEAGLAGLLAIARTQQRLSGRKTVIYFAQGIRSDAFTEDRLRDIIGAANRAGVSIYVIDANALTVQADQSMVAMMAIGGAKSARAMPGPEQSPATGLPQTSPAPPAGLAPMVSNQFDRYEAADPNGNRNPLVSLALSTGGAYVPSGGDVKKPLRRMVEDMTTYYEASYPAPMENFDGQFRPIAVKPVREGLHISSRAGYFALPPGSGMAIRPFEAPLLKLLDDPQLRTEVAFQARVLRLGELPTGDDNSFVVQVPVSALESRNDPNTNLYSLHVSMFGQIKSKAGLVVARFGEDIPRHGSLNSKDSQPDAITMQRHFTAEPGDYVLEAAIVDVNSGKAGTLRTDFQIPRVPTGPSLSDLTLVQHIDPVPEEADPEEPMRYGSGKVVPSFIETVQKGTKDVSFFFVVHPDPETTEKPRLEMAILRGGEAITQVPLSLRQTNGPSAIPYLASIQTAGLPTGEYQVVERLTQGGNTTERNLSFRIVGGEAEARAAVAGSDSKDDSDAVLASGFRVPETDGSSGHGVTITSLPPDASPAPSPEQLQQLIADARRRALDYGKNLPNFVCIEMTNRSVDATGQGRWKNRDSIAEMLTYRDNQETRTTIEVNGKKSSLRRADMNTTWPLSVGEFGAMLNLVFQPSSKTTFEWKEAATLGDGSGMVQVLTYRVAHENATIVLSEGNDQAAVGFHGLVYIDSSTGGVRRVTLEADGIPHTHATRAAAMTVDYAYVAISGRDYLLPVRSSVSLQKAHRKVELNEITFRNYRRFASRAKIKMIQ